MVSLEDIVVNDQDIKSNNWFVDILIHKQWLLQKLFSIIKNNSKSMNTRHLKAIDEFTLCFQM